MPIAVQPNFDFTLRSGLLGSIDCHVAISSSRERSHLLSWPVQRPLTKPGQKHSPTREISPKRVIFRLSPRSARGSQQPRSCLQNASFISPQCGFFVFCFLFLWVGDCAVILRFLRTNLSSFFTNLFAERFFGHENFSRLVPSFVRQLHRSHCSEAPSPQSQT